MIVINEFEAIEVGDLEALRSALDAGADVNAVRDGLSLLQHALDIEVDTHVQTGQPLHVDATALLIARGADPFMVPPGGISAEHFAFQAGHWLAMEIFKAKR